MNIEEKVKSLTRVQLEELCINQNAMIKPVNKVTPELLDAGLRVRNIQLGSEIINSVISMIELIQEKGDEINLKDVIVNRK